MRLVSVTVLGTALIAAGMLAPATGEATDQDGVAVKPGMVRPGEQVRLSVPGCVGDVAARSEAFAGRTVNGIAIVRRDATPSTYPVEARCGARRVTGEVQVAGRVAWPDLLPPRPDDR
ncbi:hypothetical protein [Actinomadura madurae]|uniref:hypothetical protein n=1 Tax=Actinomadura madurae TaxID=1993 RepID=UPI0020261285|nr:hypothetical protein [Actinomadura madurae]MCP9952877.1 hypothetical protein [Actinomadura madurae]MCP9969642.1 hypothetical protein [Actinomadura madurae]MCP9982097.1 hypothetical protein [Actinomadura madurae]MCQ0006377.1 hypothetical protein [Actinomadura madurae]MCQ0018338.1 hypothetical protein [Actinomadura madurae]